MVLLFSFPFVIFPWSTAPLCILNLLPPLLIASFIREMTLYGSCLLHIKRKPLPLCKSEEKFVFREQRPKLTWKKMLYLENTLLFSFEEIYNVSRKVRPNSALMVFLLYLLKKKSVSMNCVKNLP